MARLFQSGAEIDAGAPTASALAPDGYRAGAIAPTRDTTVFRSGVASWKFESAGSTAINAPYTIVDGNSYFFRAYVRVATAPTTAIEMMFLGSSFNDPCARLRLDGGIELLAGHAARGSPSASICDSTWHRVELRGTTQATTQWASSELRLDGATVATYSTPYTHGTGLISWGFNTAPGTSQIMHMDDVALNDSTGGGGTQLTSYPGDSNTIVLTPTGDSAIGTGWTGGAGGTTSLFTAVDNTPPVGVADAGTNTSQVRNATSNANSNYDATMATYTAAGVPAGATVNAVVPWVATAAPVATSAKLGTVGVVSNPAITNVNLAAAGTAGAFWQGVAAGTYPTGWKWSAGTITNAPTVTLGTAPVMRVTQVTASTRIAIAAGMFIYVDYTPAASSPKKTRVLSIPNLAVSRAAVR